MAYSTRDWLEDVKHQHHQQDRHVETTLGCFDICSYPEWFRPYAGLILLTGLSASKLSAMKLKTGRGTHDKLCT